MSNEELKFLQDAPLVEIQKAVANVPREEMEDVARKLYKLKEERIAELEADVKFCEARIKASKNPEEINDSYAEITYDHNCIAADEEIMRNFLELYFTPEETKTRGGK